MQCIGDEEVDMDALIAHIVFNPVTGTYKPGNGGLGKLEATIIPFSCPDPRQIRDIPAADPTRLNIYPNSSATICIGGLTHLQHMGRSERNLVPSKKKVCTVREFFLVCKGLLPVSFKIGSQTTKQVLYICNKIQIINFSKAACIDVRILPPCFPRSMTSLILVTCDSIHPGTQTHKTDKPKFEYPKTPPYPPTHESIQNLKKWLLDQFATTVFNKSGKFPVMPGSPAHIHFKDGVIPKAKYNPIPVLYHYREEVKKVLWDDVERGIITPVPISAPP